MAVTPAFCPLSLQTLFNSNNVPIVGGQIYVNAAGTTTLVTTYADAAMQTPNPNPLLTDGFGRIPPIFVAAGSYKVVAQDQNGAQLFLIDNLPGGVDYVAQANAAAAASGAALAGTVTGDVKAKHGSTVDAGWVVLNGQTIGNAGSQATARANADTQALFIYLWNGDASLQVFGGRGVTATSDFNAGKTIALPDYRGRAIVGVDQMGAPATAGVITTASTPTPNQVGAQFGSETETLSVAQLPAITPKVMIDQGVQNPGVHQHNATTSGTSSDGLHQHVVNENPHSHQTSIATQNGNVGTQSGGVQALNYTNSATQATAGAKTGLTLDNGGSGGGHGHAIIIDQGGQGGSHTHTAACSSFGSGNAHPNAQPSILVYWFIRL